MKILCALLCCEFSIRTCLVCMHMYSYAIMGVYETAIDTIMMCFLEDESENDLKGNISFASGSLKKFMSVSILFRKQFSVLTLGLSIDLPDVGYM